MRSTGDRGRIYRRCGCRDIADGDHGTWTFAVDVPAPRHRRTTLRRGGFVDHDAA